MESRINKLANITSNGLKCPKWNHMVVTDNDVKKWETRFFSLSFLESNKKK